MQRAIVTRLGSLTSYRYGVDSYDSTKLGLGKLMVQVSGSGESAYAGPCPVAVARPNEQLTAIPSVFPWALQWQNNTSGELDWVFFADNAATAATRRINLYTFNRRTAAFNWQGFVTLTYPTATNHTIRGFRMTYDTYTVGTVAVSGTGVTGTSTAWSTSRLAVGSRIGFGSTDPTQISTWYEISAIGSNTSITLTASAGTISAGASYVIEDLRAITVTTNATTTNGGVYVTKGLRFENFTSAGTTISAATTTDNARAVYWLADASTVTNTVAFGCGIEAMTSWTSQNLWVADTLANPVLFKYNLRGALTLTAGKDTTTLAFKTGAGGAITGTTSQANNGRLATLSHGPGSGSSCFYFTTTTRVYRTAAVSGITTGSTTWLSGGDVMTEVPPGGTNSYAASANMNSIEYANALDKFILLTTPASNVPYRSYVTGYNTTNSQFDRVFGCDNRQLDLSSADATLYPVPSMSGGGYSAWSEGGICYIATIGTTSSTNRIYAVPLAADWEYAATTGSRIIFPKMTPSDIDKSIGVYASGPQILGGTSGKNLGTPVDPYRIYYRTSGISDDSGSWTLVDGTGLFSATVTSDIQFMVEFRTISDTCLPARLCSLAFFYEDTGTLTNYQLSATKSDAANKRFAWRFATAFGSSVPALKVRLYDAVSGSLLVTDNTASPTGTFERSTDGSTWSSWNNTDKGNETTYLRYTPSSLADNVNVRPVLTLN